jgi:hypothetical protein
MYDTAQTMSVLVATVDASLQRAAFDSTREVLFSLTFFL